MKELQDLARQLLTDGTVKVVIGYEEGPRGVRPAFVTDPEQTGSLIFDTRCVQNLATYLNPRRKQITTLGKPAIVVKGCDARSVAALLRETQIQRENVVVIAMRCGGVLESNKIKAELTSDTVSVRCLDCEDRDPKLYDYVLGTLPPAPPVNTRRMDQIAALEKMSPAQRWHFWTDELSRCIRCYACREVCPTCYCVRCTADNAQPQWVDPSPTPAGNRAWQMMRVLHQAGRCVDCMECERACPEDIPLGLFSRYVSDVVKKRFDYSASEDPSVVTPLGAFRTDDDEEFIR